ncbi:hypothetical protein HYFRA_00005901 [Hymenoscyphus fraxineus]|uniref:Uncharacterized protein n=1 Tax=Hymenoscyphus fraxineus TaxID=746836 RepID=A0A9N9KU32_9HELO|nr:hypothetical protein HYFRA_00005901 [Hymenoscyphus fraxineus]
MGRGRNTRAIAVLCTAVTAHFLGRPISIVPFWQDLWVRLGLPVLPTSILGKYNLIYLPRPSLFASGENGVNHRATWKAPKLRLFLLRTLKFSSYPPTQRYDIKSVSKLLSLLCNTEEILQAQPHTSANILNKEHTFQSVSNIHTPPIQNFSWYRVGSILLLVVEAPFSTYTSSTMMFSILVSLALAVNTVVALPATIDAPIPGRYAKTYLPDCAIEGSFVENPTSKHYGPQAVHDIIACQTQCHYTGGCVMYSWDINAKANACYLYAANGSMNVASTVFTDTVAQMGLKFAIWLPLFLDMLTSLVFLLADLLNRGMLNGDCGFVD